MSHVRPSWWHARRVRLLAVALVLSALGVAVYAPFLFGEQVMLYKGIGSDSLNEEYPNALHLSDYIRTTGVPLWSFQLGIGQSLYPFTSLLLFNPVAWLPQSAIAAALPWQHLLKLIIAGLLFYRFLELRGMQFRCAMAGGACIALSAAMCLGSCWSVAANELIGFACLLVAMELALAKGRWIYVPLAVGVLGLLTVFHLYLAAVLLSLYVPLRIVAAYGWRWRPMLRLGLPLALAALLGCGVAAVLALECAAAILNSPRGPGTGSGAATLAAKPVFGLESPRFYLTCVMRWFSTDMLATGTKFRGWYNYFEAPANYCGLFCLVLLPQVFVRATTRQRVLYSLFLGLLIFPVIFPWFRYAFWAFQGDYFRTFSLFRVFGVIALAMTALSRIVTERRMNHWLLAATLLVLLAALWVPTAKQNTIVEPTLRAAATVYLLAYTAILALGRVQRRESLAAWLVLVVGATELVAFGRITVAHRDVVTKAELTSRTGYNDYTIEAMRDLRARDRGFYRVTKLYSSSPAIHSSFNDDMVFGYFGTRVYSSFNDMDYIRFLSVFNVIGAQPTETDTRWAPGLADRPLLSTFAAEKYVLMHESPSAPSDPNYELIAQHANIQVYRNRQAVPFGLTFDRYALLSDFLTWPPAAKEHALFYAAIVPDTALAAGGPLAQTRLPRMDLNALTRLAADQPIPARTDELRRQALAMTSFSHNRITGHVQLPRDAILVFQTAFSEGWRAFVDGKRVPVTRADVGLIGVPVANGAHRVEISYLPPLLPAGIAISVLSLLALAIACWRWPRLPDPGPIQNRGEEAQPTIDVAAAPLAS